MIIQQQKKYLMSQAMRLILESAQAQMSAEEYKGFESDISKQISFFITNLEQFKAGEDRAKVIGTLLERFIDQNKKEYSEIWKEISCKSGCSACCHQWVEITHDEASVLSKLVINGDVQIDRDKLLRQAKVKDSDEWILLAKKNWKESGCVFLGEGGNCRVYESRPAACRKYFVGSPPELCGDVASTEDNIAVYLMPMVEMLATAAMTINEELISMPSALLKKLEPTSLN